MTPAAFSKAALRGEEKKNIKSGGGKERPTLLIKSPMAQGDPLTGGQGQRVPTHRPLQFRA